MKLPFGKTAFTLVIIAFFLSIVGKSFAQEAKIELARKPVYRGEVIFIRGGFNVFSRGLDQMAAKLEKNGVKTRIYQHKELKRVASEVIANQKKFGRKPIIMVGHSWGANALLEVAEILRKKRLRVNYAATFAATEPSPVPSNVRKLTNYYFKTDGWGKRVVAGKGFRGRLKNIDMSNKPDVHHFNIEKQTRLQNQVINNVLRILRLRRRS